MPPLPPYPARRADEWETRIPRTPGHVAWPHHDPGAGIVPQAPGPRGIPPVRWPQGSLEWLLQIGNVPADPVPAPVAGTGGLVESGQLALFGGSLQNTATTAATVTLFDGMDAKGGQVAIMSIAASSTFQLNLPRAGVLLEMGLFMVVTGGVVVGTLYVAHLWKYPFTPPGE